MPSREEDPPRRKKDREDDSSRVKDKDKDKDKERHRSSKIHRKKSSLGRARSRDRSPDLSRPTRSSISEIPSRSGKKVTVAVPEMERRSSAGETAPTGSYPTFSKAHSREAVGSREEIGKPGKPKVSIVTPDATDAGREDRGKGSRPRTPASGGAASPRRAPPSPPLTSDEADLRRTSSANIPRRASQATRPEEVNCRRSADHGSRPYGSHLRGGVRSSPRNISRTDLDSDGSAQTDGSRVSTSLRKSPSKQAASRGASGTSQSGSTVTQTTTSDSQATSIAPDRVRAPRPPPLASTKDSSSPSHPESSPQTPMTQDSTFPSHEHLPKETPPNNNGGPRVLDPPFGMADSNVAHPSMPPPPPPPMAFSQEAPRVDYLLQNGGLPYLLPRMLIPAAGQAPVQSYQQYASPRLPQSGTINAAQIFAPISKRLEDFGKVMLKNGSVAVATGYRSVARRLLDRLEHVFARNISSEKCECAVCCLVPNAQLSDEEDTGVSWGEILEFVSGRRELPQWPPFTLGSDTPGLGIAGATQSPMQKLDPDVPEEYREHYLKQNDKTKRSVQNWLENQQADFVTSPPQEIDDETLSFAMLTRLDPERRPLFTALMKGQSIVPASRAPTPAPEAEAETKNNVLAKAALALQRLYRLSTTPRDPECTIYLLNNPDLHSMLATLAAVSPGEWDILVSGRFDGFLWSGAETAMPPSASAYGSPAASRVPSRGPTPFSRNTTPFSGGLPLRNNTFSPLRKMASPGPNGLPSRGPTPALSSTTTGGQGPAPVQMDEETEIAVLAEVEREIFRGMEVLEDQFELVHQQAEALRQQLRQRSAGLAMAAQARRGSMASEVEVRIGTPAEGLGWGLDALDDSEGLLDDGRSELAPDDSASNISYARRRRPKRTERRTPAPVEEEDEDVGDASRRRRR